MNELEFYAVCVICGTIIILAALVVMAEILARRSKERRKT